MAALGLECGACGSIMTTDSRRYDAVHDKIEERAIAEMETAPWDKTTRRLRRIEVRLHRMEAKLDELIFESKIQQQLEEMSSQ